MLGDLYPSGGGPSDPLTLAEEYRSTLGPGALEGIIRTHIRDEEWEPDILHHQLLRFPWSDVLTTNWDTLLERSASADPDISYDPVRVTADIARAKRPRIVKLHGSMPSYLPFIFTEEDFRTYPERFAPFVNLAQQTLLENELCLLGFSGEDPNFLKWAGWVRDKLGTAARPIRLIGVLNLAPSRRRLFEARNITPIDLSPLVEEVPREDRHRRAMELLFKYLWQSRPSTDIKWECKDEKNYDLASAATPELKIARLTEIWRQDRERHPGWLVTPYVQRVHGRFGIQDAFRLLANDLPQVSPQARSAMLFEAVWRWDALHWSMPPFFEEIAETSLSAEEDRTLPEDHRILLHAALVREARHRRDWPVFDARIARLMSLRGVAAKNAGTYEFCLRARDELDYEYILENASSLHGPDPVWGLRKAALLAEILETEAAARAVQATHKEIRRRRSQDRRSLWLLSREAWASLMMRSAWFELRQASPDEEWNEWPLIYKGSHTDPWDELSAISDSVEEADRKKRTNAVDRQPLFDAGAYRIAGTVRFVSTAVSQPHEQLTFLAEQVGLPLGLGNSDIIGRRWAQAIELNDQNAAELPWLAMRSILSHDYDLLEEWFSRLGVAGLPKEMVEQMVDKLQSAIAFGRQQMSRKGDKVSDWASRLKTMCELLSRLCTKLDGDRAIACFRLGASLLADKSLGHWWLLKGLDSLLRRSIQALEPERRKEIALDVLRLPLPNEAQYGGIERDFPEAAELLDADVWKTRENSYGWNSRVAHLLNQAGSGNDRESRRHAVFRLLRLYEAGALTTQESEDFGVALWSDNDAEGVQSETNLLPHVFLHLPTPDPSLPINMFNQVIRAVVAGSREADLLVSLHSASFTLKHEYRVFPLDAGDAATIFDNLLAWQPTPINDTGLFENTAAENDYSELAIVRLLGSTIIPALSAEAVEGARADEIFRRLNDGSMPSLMMALPALVSICPAQSDRSYKAIQTGLLSGYERTVQSALAAVVTTIERYAGNSAMPPYVVSEVVHLVVMRREAALVSALSVIAKMVKADAVSADERLRLVKGIDLLCTETSYDGWRDQSRKSDVGLIRRGVVKLCAALRDAGDTSPAIDQWLQEAADDPLPEVRYALREEDS